MAAELTVPVPRPACVTVAMPSDKTIKPKRKIRVLENMAAHFIEEKENLAAAISGMRNEIVLSSVNQTGFLSGRKKVLDCRRVLSVRHQQKEVVNTPILRETTNFESKPKAQTFSKSSLIEASNGKKSQRNAQVLRAVASFRPLKVADHGIISPIAARLTQAGRVLTSPQTRFAQCFSFS